MKMRSAASRISARRRWPSPLALRADRREVVTTDKGVFLYAGFPLRDPKSARVTSAVAFAPHTRLWSVRLRRLEAGRRPAGARKRGTMSQGEPKVAELPSVMRTRGWADYGLVDSGAGRKLERYGRFS